MFHHFFDQGRRSPGAALRATQLWMLAADRTVPEAMPPSLAELCGELDLSEMRFWGAFSHHGW